MRPIILHGHQRPITRICFNRDGDLIFTAAKNTVVNVWFTANGERLGSFSGHDGVIWWLDADWRTENLLTASGDYHAKLWDISTGNCLSDYEAQAPVRTCGISFCGNLLFITTDDARIDGKTKKCEVIVLDKRDPSHVSYMYTFCRFLTVCSVVIAQLIMNSYALASFMVILVFTRSLFSGLVYGTLDAKSSFSWWFDNQANVLLRMTPTQKVYLCICSLGMNSDHVNSKRSFTDLGFNVCARP
ncbi:Eukaryotic translation initiation factor 3 subunit I [Fasciola hepatica]|uniref:Serine-threonine kinase receptor-associated protein n=1 Tax=Fasciola hepatica TaxID=6192 RepID=A0A4E0R7T7_FASHE|nr:Eukaryotic translation initiation factor 3 subunit I [Fasciola hepatica]